MARSVAHRALFGLLCLVLASACSETPAPEDGGGAGDAGIDAGPPPDPYVSDWQDGDPGLTSIEQIAFAPDGTLFVGDGAGGRLVAVDLRGGDPSEQDANHFDDIPGFGATLAAALGGSAMLGVPDLDVHPITHLTHLVARNSTQTAIVTVNGAGEVFLVDLTNVRHAIVTFAPDAAGSYISDLDVGETHLVASVGSRTFTSGRVMTVAFPIAASSSSSAATTRTYHRSHRAWEESDTIAPVDRTMVVDDVDVPFVAASYACAPVVRLGLDELTAGGQVLGETPFDIGAGRQLLDLFAYQSGGAGYVLINYNAFDGTQNLVRAERSLLEQSDELDEAAPVVVNTMHLSRDARVTAYPEYTGLVVIAPRGDDHFVGMYNDARLASHVLP